MPMSRAQRNPTYNIIRTRVSIVKPISLQLNQRQVRVWHLALIH